MEKKNKHNYTKLYKYVNFKLISVGTGTYGIINATSWKSGDESLDIGDYVSIADGVQFILGGEHRYNVYTTYPFYAKRANKIEAFSKGSITIEDFVWIGTNALILSGIKVGCGAIIGAGSVVTKNVEPYSIVGGNPARHIKYRFSKEIIDLLVQVDFSFLVKNGLISIDEMYSEPTIIDIERILLKYKQSIYLYK